MPWQDEQFVQRERLPLIHTSLQDILTLLQKADLLKTVSQFGDYHPFLVREFVVNLHTPFYTPEHQEYQKVFVRGRCIDFSATTINAYLGVKHTLGVKAVALSALAQELTGGTTKSWPTKGNLLSSSLTAKYSVLFRIGLANWAPTTHGSSVSKELALLIYQIGTCSPLNFASFVLAHLVRHAKSCSPNLQIGFPT